MTAGALDRLKTALADRYAIQEELGAGGMATVYLAEDLKHHRKVAVKVLRPELTAILGAERFLKEIEVTANLQHPHILPLFDSGVADSFLYYVMPYVEGESLRDKLNRDKQLAMDESIEITEAVASALDHAHRHDIIHRDIKPENILLQDGQAVVSDFGIALALDVDWSPDATALVYEELDWELNLGQISTVPLTGGETRTLDVVGDFAHWSPSGDLIVFHGFDGLRVISPNGGESRLIAGVTEEYGEPFYAAWAADGRSLYYVAKDARGSSIHTVPAIGGPSRLLVHFDDPARQHTRYGFATDGRTFYFTMGSHESDVWVAELERR